MFGKKKKESKSATDINYNEQRIASYWSQKFKEAMISKAPYTQRWNVYADAYKGDFFKNKSKPEYKSDLVSNYIFSIIETIRPIMLDNDPKFQAMPRHPDGMPFSTDLQEAFAYEWDREKMSPKLYRELINSLICGTAVFYLPWNSGEKNVKAIPISPFNIFPDPLATSVDDAEYIIYSKYMHAEHLRKAFPKHAHKLTGGSVNYSELVYENDKDAHLDNQILILEVWARDYEKLDFRSDADQYIHHENGRVFVIAPELGLVLSEKPNPYDKGHLPFKLLKDYDVPGKFWGEGEIAQLLSPQKHMNELNNAILDNAKSAANMPWIIDKNAGIGAGKITSRPGLIIRKNPGSEVRREEPPNMPSYIVNAVDQYKGDMEQISGIFDTLKGNSETGVYTAQGILALQEAGQARIRLKVKLMEQFLGELASLWFCHMKQFWTEDRWVRVVRADGTYSFATITQEKLGYDYDIKIMAGSTMSVNRGAMLDLMIRLAQTPMPDGQPLVDRQAVLEYVPSEVKSATLSRMQNQAMIVEQQMEQITQGMQQLGQELQRAEQESDQADQQTDQVLSEITKAVEQINKKILQLEKEHDRLEEEKRMEEERTKLREQSYNEGYHDAEKQFKPTKAKGSAELDTMMGDPTQLGAMSAEEQPLGDGLEEPQLEDLGEGQVAELPDDILQGIEQMSDEELQVLIESNPEVMDLIG